MYFNKVEQVLRMHHSKINFNLRNAPPSADKIEYRLAVIKSARLASAFYVMLNVVAGLVAFFMLVSCLVEVLSYVMFNTKMSASILNMSALSVATGTIALATNDTRLMVSELDAEYSALQSISEESLNQAYSMLPEVPGAAEYLATLNKENRPMVRAEYRLLLKAIDKKHEYAEELGVFA